MFDYETKNLRNVCLIGHGNAGKTSLCEALLYKSGASDRLGKVLDGNTVSDYDPEEIKRKISINTTLAPLEWKNVKINIIDTPGYFDFIGEQLEGVEASDNALIMVSGKSGVSAGTERSWDFAQKNKLPVMFFVNKIDDHKADYQKTLNELKEHFGKSVAPCLFPIKDGDDFIGFIDIISMQAKMFKKDGSISFEEIPDDMKDIARENRDMLMEAVAEVSEEFMEKFFEGEEFTDEEITYALKVGVKEGNFVPVLCGSVLKGIGVEILLDYMRKYFASPCEHDAPIGEDPKTGEPVEIEIDKDKPLCAKVFKTIVDPYIGKMSFIKVISGTLTLDSTVLNANKGENEKISKLFVLRGKKQIDVPKLYAGDIGATTKLAVTDTSDTLCSPKMPVVLEKIEFPEPVLSLAVLPKAKGDEEKISSGLNKLLEEDPTFKVIQNKETHQTIVAGTGEQHLNIITTKLQTKFGVGVDLVEPKIAYRETIKKKVKVEGKHKKQSGGHGQYGHVWIEFEPCDSETLVFEEKIFGGSVPKNFFPAVEKGLRDSVVHGVLAGYPVVNLKATLVDGSYHSVDSSEMAFKTAANLAYKEGLKQANPVLLEPVGKLKVVAKDEYTGDIVGDINKRRGKVMGMNPVSKGITEVEAEVPMGEMAKYAIDLRALTNGRGKFSFKFDHYEEAPFNICEKVVAESKESQK
ncbi:MAG: elongation factor G [Ruminococcaceae bacterium]|nr:elongation factor G [Oscillospiraceae bacterium]